MIRLERKKPSGFRPEYVFTRIPEREAGRLFIWQDPAMQKLHGFGHEDIDAGADGKVLKHPGNQ